MTEPGPTISDMPLGVPPERLIEVRATIHLPGLPLGATALVDPEAPYIRDCLAAAFLFPLKPSGP